MRLILTHDDGTEIRTYSEVEHFLNLMRLSKI